MGIHMATTCAAVGLIGLVIVRTVQRFRWGRFKSKRLMTGKTVVITGANSGIGKETAKELATRDARVILACRDVVLACKAAEEIRKYTNKGEILVKHLNLASFESIRAFANDVITTEKTVDVLINNAGVFQCPYLLTVDGYETQFAVNYLGHFLLTNLLLKALNKPEDTSRIIIVSSSYYRKGRIDFENLNNEKSYSKAAAYNNSKLAGIMFGLELNRHLEMQKSKISVHMLCPGMVFTNLGRHVNFSWWKKLLFAPLAFLIVRTPSEGCQTVLHCTVSEELNGSSGKLYKNCKEAIIDKIALDEAVSRQLWDHSVRMTKLDTRNN